MALAQTLLELLKLLLECRVEKLKLKKFSAAYDLRRRIENDINADQLEAERLRLLGGDVNHRIADQLRERALRTQGITANLPTPSVGAESGNPDRN